MSSSSDESDLESTSASKPENPTLGEMEISENRNDSKEIQRLQALIEELRGKCDKQEKEFDEYKERTVTKNRTQSEEVQRLLTKKTNAFNLIQELRKENDSQKKEKFDLYTEITLLKQKEASCDERIRHYNCQIGKIEEREKLKKKLKSERESSIAAFQSVIAKINELGPMLKKSQFNEAIKRSLKEKIREVEKRKEIALEEKQLKKKEKEQQETENSDLKMEIERLKEQLLEEKNQSAILHRTLIADFQEKLAQDPEFLKNELHEMEVIDLKGQIEANNLEIEGLRKELEDVNQFISRHLLTGQAPKEDSQKVNTHHRPAQKLIIWWEKEGKIKRPPIPTPRPTTSNTTPAKELELANQQIAMIIENNDLLRAKKASEHDQEKPKMFSSSDESDLESTSASKPFDFEEEYEKIIAPIIEQSIGNLTLSGTEISENRNDFKEIQRLQALIEELLEKCDSQEKEFEEYKKQAVTENRTQSEKNQLLQTLIRQLREERDNQEKKINEYKKMTVPRTHSEEIQRLETLNQQLRKESDSQKKERFDLFTEITLLKDKKSSRGKEINMEKMEERNQKMENLETANFDLKMEIERLKEQLMEEKNQSAILHRTLIADFQEKLALDPEFLKNELHEMEVIELNGQIMASKLEIEGLKKDLEDVSQFISRHISIGQATKEKGQEDNKSLRPAQKLIIWWQKEGKNKRPPIPIPQPPLFDGTSEETIQILKSKVDQQTKELEFANQQIAMIIEDSDLHRAKEASEHAQEVTKLKDQIEELNKTICYFSNQLSDTA